MKKAILNRRGKILERRRPTEYCLRACTGNCTQVSGRTTPCCLVGESQSCEHEEYTVKEQAPPRMLPLKERKRTQKKGVVNMSVEMMYQRCAGIDVHLRFLVVCLIIVEAGKRRKEVRTFRNETADLLALRAWLLQEGCTHVAM